MPRVVVDPQAIPRLAPVCVRCATVGARERVDVGVGSSLPLPFAFGHASFALCGACARTVKVKRAAARTASFLVVVVVLALVGLRFRPLLFPALAILAVLPSILARRFERAVVGVSAKRQLFDDRVALEVRNAEVVEGWLRTRRSDSQPTLRSGAQGAR